MRKRTGGLAIAGLAAIFFGSDSWAVCYVDQNAKGSNSGTTWADAYVHPQWALLNACAEIWVAKGIYTPVSAGSDPSVSFEIPAGTKMYGGFAGNESSVDQRLPSINHTILSGDVDHNDSPITDPYTRSYLDIQGRNSNNVLVMHSTAATPITRETVLDGFFITGGNAVSDSIFAGGGLSCHGDGNGGECSPVVNNVVFSGNAGYYGGAISIDALGKDVLNVQIVNSQFVGNHGYSSGGAIQLLYNTLKSVPVFENVTFYKNSASQTGGAINNPKATGSFRNVTFVQNVASEDRAFGYGGAISFSNDSVEDTGTPTFNNVTFTKNRASKGGAIYRNSSGSTAFNPMSLANVILWDDDAPEGPEIFNDDQSMAFIDHSVVSGDCPDIRSVCIAVSSESPRLSSMAQHGGNTLTSLPGAGGSAIDSGSDTSCPTFDQRGVSRPQGRHCDIGAVEWQPSDDVIFRNGFQ